MVAMRDIRRFARAIAREFKPRRIILFGSYAYGKPTEDSDVDLMVVMPHQGDYVRKAIDIRLRLDAPFPLDLLVRSAKEIRQRYRLEDWFIREIVDNGKILYEAAHR
jgi:predicted nucleotidyltransferase